MRVNTAPTGTTPGNVYLAKQQEFLNFAVLYARYEIVGMKAEVTLNARNTFESANLVGGMAPRMP